MSREYVFYPGIKKDGKYNCLYWKKKEDKLVPAEIYWSSGSFIEGDWFLSNGRRLDASELHEDILDLFTWDESENRECFLYELPFSVLATAKPERGLIEGYIPIEELAILESMEDSFEKQDYISWQMEKPVPATVIAEMSDDERKKYGKFSFVDTYSPGYVSQHLLEIANCNYDNDVCILMYFSC